MSLIEEIKNNWLTTRIGFAQELLSLSPAYHAWTVKLQEGYGVALPFNSDCIIVEDFAHARIYTSDIRLNHNETHKALLLISDHNYEDQFAALCAELVNPGPNGTLRAEILNDPVSWWSKWRELLGNRNIESRIYDVLGELCALEYLLENGDDPIWCGPNGATYDIQTDESFFEIKSSVVLSRKEITVSNRFQMDASGKRLYVIFCIFEPAQNGITINRIIEKLKQLGYNIYDLNAKLEKCGLEQGKSARERPYILHGMHLYTVDESFPSITERSFKGDCFPLGITSINYTVSLDGLASTVLIINI